MPVVRLDFKYGCVAILTLRICGFLTSSLPIGNRRVFSNDASHRLDPYFMAFWASMEIFTRTR
jgi:hypothetical protein